MSTAHKILIVDDEAGIRESLASILRDEHYSVEAVGSAEEALDRIAAGDLHVVLLDIWLPGIDGMEALSRIRNIPDAPAVIMISGHGTIETAIHNGIPQNSPLQPDLTKPLRAIIEFSYPTAGTVLELS